jgi:hypothetical protein
MQQQRKLLIKLDKEVTLMLLLKIHLLKQQRIMAITTFFLNLPIRRLKRGVFHTDEEEWSTISPEAIDLVT